MSWQIHEGSSSSLRGAEVLVLVLPLGGTPDTVFREYVELVALQCQRIELNALRSFYSAQNKSPFRDDFWENGSMRLRFHFSQENRESSEWGDFQAYRKVMGVLGLCYAPASDIDEVYVSFNNHASRYASVKARRCFVFEPSEEQVAKDSKTREHLIMFPPGERQALEYHVTTMMHDFCAHMLMAFEEYVLHAESMSAALTSPLDINVPPLNDSSQQKKQRLGRVQKSIGDHCLLAGSPEDAHNHYMTAIDLARQSGDIVWHAGSIEGLVTSKIVQFEERLVNNDIDEEGSHSSYFMDDEDLSSLRILYYEAISLYSRRNATLLAQESTLKLASIISKYDSQPTKEVVELLSNAIERSSGNETPNEEKMVVMLEVAQIMQSVGFQRKAALAIWSAIRFARSSEDDCRNFMQKYLSQSLGVSHNDIALKLCLELLSMCETTETAPEDDNCNAIDAQNYGSEPLWHTLQRGVLARTLEWSSRGGDAINTWSSAARLLSYHHRSISYRSQQLLSEVLKTSASRISFGGRSIKALTPPPKFRETQTQPTYLVPYPWKSFFEDAHAGGVFLYTPYENVRNSETPRSSSSASTLMESQCLEECSTPWVCGDESAILIEIDNPYMFDIMIMQVQLSTTGVLFEAQPQSIMLRKQSKNILTLRGTANSCGTLSFEGVNVTVYGVTCFQRWSVPKPITISVVHKLPFLHRTSTDAEGAITISQIEGERTTLDIDVMNSGLVSVTEIYIAVHQKRSTSSARQRFSKIEIHQSDFQSKLPIAPGTTATLTFDIIACQHSSRSSSNSIKELIEIILQYGGSVELSKSFDKERNNRPQNADASSSRYGRRLVVPLCLETRPGPRLKQVKLCSYANSEKWRHQKVLEIDVFNPTIEDIQFKAGSKSNSSKYDVFYLNSMCGRTILIPVERLAISKPEVTTGEKVNDMDLSLTWLSKSKLVGDLSGALDNFITCNIPLSDFYQKTASIIGFFATQKNGFTAYAQVDHELRLLRMAPSIIHFSIQSQCEKDLILEVSFMIEVNKSNSLNEDANILIPLGSWKSCRIKVCQNALTRYTISCLPVESGTCRIIPKLKSIVGSEDECSSLLHPIKLVIA